MILSDYVKDNDIFLIHDRILFMNILNSTSSIKKIFVYIYYNLFGEDCQIHVGHLSLITILQHIEKETYSFHDKLIGDSACFN